jgi:FimV-like protein
LEEIQKISTAKASKELDKQDYSWKHHGTKAKNKCKAKNAKHIKPKQSASHIVKAAEKRSAVPVSLPSEPIVDPSQPLEQTKSSNVAVSSPMPEISAPSVVNSVQADLVTNLTKDLQNLKETTDAKIADLTARNAELEKKISGVDSSVKTLQQQLSDLSQKVQKIEKQMVGTFANLAIVTQNLLASLGGLGVVLFVLLLIILFVLVRLIAKICSKWGKRHNLFHESPTSEIDTHAGLSDESDYDLMGSKEGVAAKLDLARVYMDMNEGNKARELLQEVIANGNTKEKAAAEEMLKKIKG